MTYIHIHPARLFVPLFIQSCPGFSIIQTLFFHYLPAQQAQYLKPKSSQLAALLRASKWQQTVIDTALPVISPVGLLRLLYDGQADLAGSDTQKDVNTEDPLRFIEKSSSNELHSREEAGEVPEGDFWL